MNSLFRKTLSVLLILLTFQLFAGPRDALRPQKYQPEIAGLVSTFLSYYHYAKLEIDDNASRRLLKEYISSLDPNRMFFLASDIDEFKKFETILDNDLLADPVKLDAPFFIFNRFKKRVYERVDVNLALLKHKFDFTKDEYYIYDRSEEPWARQTADLDELWRLRLKEEMVRFKLREKPEDETLELLHKRYARLKKNTDEYEPMDILERYLASFAEIFDPHSSYFKPATKDNFDIQMGHSLEGIGATLTRDGEYTKVVEIVKGGPADRSGRLHANDKIIAVGQGDDKAEDVVDLRLDKVVKKIRGPKSTKVRLTIIPADATDQSQTREVILIRDRVEITLADAKSEVKEVKDYSGRSHRFGVIEIPSFYMDSTSRNRGDKNYKSTTRDVRKLLQDLEKEKIDGLVIDLRQNGGGSLDEAIRLTGLFIAAGPVVQIRNHRGMVQVENDPDPKQVFNGPLLVLTSVFSASASEIFASAIQDYDRGIVVGGQTTHGKGTVQNVLGLQGSLSRQLRKNFDDDIAGALKVTTHKFYRISGGSTQFKGVRPDIVFPSHYDGMKITEEALEYALPWDEIEPVSYKPYELIRQALPFLKANSAKRVTNTPEFRYVREDLEYRKKLDEENRVSLNLEKRLKEKKGLEDLEKSRDEDRKLRLPVVQSETETEAEDGEKAVIPDFELEEALKIIRDLVNFNGNRLAGTVPNPKKESL